MPDDPRDRLPGPSSHWHTASPRLASHGYPMASLRPRASHPLPCSSLLSLRARWPTAVPRARATDGTALSASLRAARERRLDIVPSDIALPRELLETVDPDAAPQRGQAERR